MEKFNREIRYKEEANTFSLEANCTESKVVFTLKDYIDWVVY
jgi:hypothetical protein